MLADKVLEIVGSGKPWTLESIVKQTGGSPSTVKGVLSFHGYGKGLYKKPRFNKDVKVRVSLSPETVAKFELWAAKESIKTSLAVLVRLAATRYIENNSNEPDRS